VLHSRGQTLSPPDLRQDQLQWQQIELAAPSLNVSLRRFVVRQVSEFERAFDAMRRDRSDVLFVIGSSLNFVNRRLIIELATQSRLPIMASWREYTQVGGLMSYGYSRTDSYRHAAIYVGKILNGAKPGDLPVEHPTRYELIINLKTAKALGLTIPPTLLSRADEVIE